MDNCFKECRVAARMTLAQAAKALNTTTRSVLRWERGDYEPSASTLKEMSLLYKTTLDKLLSNPTQPPSVTYKRAAKGAGAKRKEAVSA